MPKIYTFLKLIGLFIAGYLMLSIAIYAIQKHLLFPSHATKTVPEDWAPTGDNSEQALLNGSCGKLHAAIWRTPNAKGTLMMFHGNGESLASLGDYVHDFHHLGYNLMSWDYPGYGQSDDCWFNQDMLLADAETAYQWLSKQEDAKKIYLFGYSIGTGIALSVAAKHQQNPVFLVAAYDAITNIATDRFTDRLPFDMLLPFTLETKQWLPTIQQPVYLIHGLKDQIIRPARARALVQNAKGKIKAEWVENASHASDTLFNYRNRWLKRLLP